MGGGELDFHMRGLSVAGFILPDGRAPSKGRLLWFLLVQIPYFLIHVLAMVLFMVEPYSLRRTLITGFLANNGLQTMVRPLHLVLFKKQVEQMLAVINTPPDSDSAQFNQAERMMRQHSKRRILRFSLLLYGYNAVVFSGVLIPAIIRTIKVAYCDDKRALQLEVCEHDSTPLFIYDYWWFSDAYALPTYFYLYAFQLAMVWVYVSIFCVSDAFVCSVMVAVAERCKFLAKIAPEALLPGARGEVTSYCKAWIKYHQQYEQLVRTVNTVLGPVVFVTHVFAAANIMVYCFMIVRDEEETIRRSALSFLVALAIQFFIFAHSGQQIINKSEQLGRAVFNADQVTSGGLQEGAVRSVLLTVMARCCGEKPEEITGLGYFTISMRFYARIISLSASYLLVMLQLQ